MNFVQLGNLIGWRHLSCFSWTLGSKCPVDAPGWVGWFQGWFCSVLLTQCDITVECALPQLENLCRAVEGTPSITLYQGTVFYVCMENFTGWKQQLPFPVKTPLLTLPSAAFSCDTKGPVTLQAVCILKKPLGKACQNFAWQEPTGLSLQIWHPVVTLFPGFNFIF